MWSILTVIRWLVMIMCRVSRNGCLNLHKCHIFLFFLLDSHLLNHSKWHSGYSNVQIIWGSHIWTLQPDILRRVMTKFVIHLSIRNQGIRIRIDHSSTQTVSYQIGLLAKLMDFPSQIFLVMLKILKKSAKKEMQFFSWNNTYSS